MSAVLTVKGVCKRYGALTALRGADLELEAGVVHGLIGPNGSGKSTFLKCLSGAEIPTGGSIYLGDKDITKATSAQRVKYGISMKFQITAVFPELSVYDNLLLAFQAGDRALCLSFSRTRKSLDKAIMEFLHRFHLEARRDDMAGSLPHGQAQWLEIGMALSRQPRILLLDEPTAGMSPQERKSTGELFLSLAGTCTLIIVEHDLDFVRQICGSLTVLDQGAVVASGTTLEIQNNARVREAYLDHG